MKLVSLALTALFFTPCLSLAARFDGRESGGGDAYAIEFVTIAEQLSSFLKTSPTSKINVEDLNKAIEKTTVESTAKELVLDGKTKDAINYPGEMKIVFNRKRWDAITSDAKPVLVLHEYLGILRIPDVGYIVSREVLGALPSSADERFQEGALSVVKTFPTIKDQYSNYQGLGFIEVSMVFSRERTINASMLVIGLPSGLSDFNYSTVDVHLEDVQSVQLDGTDLVVKGTYSDPASGKPSKAIRRIKIKKTKGSDEYLNRPILKL